MLVVFLGPSLNVSEAQRLAPNAILLPPARMGDIIRAMRLNPIAILLIDGNFEATSSVWHKEILYAISCNIKVYGAASMGALRAAELDELGMIGIGKIYELYKNQGINDDDEVAVLHKPKIANYEPLTDAMVNIRSTVDTALHEEVITPELALDILNSAKMKFYQKRILANVCDELSSDFNKASAIQKFKEWYVNGGYINQKQIDTIQALGFAVKNFEEPVNFNIKLNHTTYINALINEINCKPLPFDLKQLSFEERVMSVSRLLDEYVVLKEIAFLLSIISMANLSLDEALLFNKEEIETFVDFYLNLHNFEKERLREVVSHLARLWFFVKKQLNDYEPTSSAQLAFLEIFMRNQNINKKSDLLNWLSNRGYTYQLFQKLLFEYIMYEHIVVKGNIDLLCTKTCKIKTWLLESLHFTGLYKKAENLLARKKPWDHYCPKFTTLIQEGDLYLFKHDFNSGFSELRDLVSQINSLNS